MTTSTEADLDELERLSREIRDAARERDLDAVDERLVRRRPLLERVAAHVSRALDPREEVVRVQGRLAAILDVDREAERLLEEGRAELESRLREIAEGRRGLQGYATGAARRASRVDARG